MSLFRQALILSAIALAAVAGWMVVSPMLGTADTAGAEGPRDRAAAVVVRPVAMAVERIRVEAVGDARARQSARLHPPTAGEVEAINFTADALVRRGDVLLELDRESERLSVDLARVRVADAGRVFDRLQSLSRTGAAAQAALDEARTTLEAARIELQRAEVALADRFVVAPFTGRIGLTDLDVGDRIGPDTEIATLDDRSSLLVRFEVPEALLGRIAAGDSVAVSAWAGDGGTITGTIADVGSRVSEQTRTFTVRALIPNADDRLRPGMSFRVMVDVTGARYPKVPEIAIQWGGEGSFLWAVTDGEARRVPVLIVQRQQAEVLVEGDLDEGDLVVIEGLHRMRPGIPVKLIEGSDADGAPVPARLERAQS